MIGATEPGGLDLAALYRDHRDDVHRFLRVRGCPPTLAEDLTQDTFERMARWATCHRWQDRGRKPLSLLYTVALNLLRDHRKSHRRRESSVADFSGDVAGLWSAAGPPVDELVAERMEQTQRRQVLVEQVETLLTDQQRRVLHLAFVEDLPDRDIGHQLGMHPHAVKGCRYRALTRLRGSDQLRALQAAGHHREVGGGR